MSSAVEQQGSGAEGEEPRSTWGSKYGSRHRFVAVDNPLLPNSKFGKVKVWQRGSHQGPGPHRFVLEWREGGKNGRDYVTGDLFTAIEKARRIDERLTVAGRSGVACHVVSIPELVRRYLESEERRADAGEIDANTVDRYQTALQKLLGYVETEGGVSRARAGAVGSEFVLGFMSYLRTLEVHPNGHPHSSPQPMTESGVRFVLSAARAAWSWALRQDPPLLPEGLRNPFTAHIPAKPYRGLVTEDEFRSEGVVRFIEHCDLYQLPLMAPLILYGLRAAEPQFVMIEHWNTLDNSLAVNCDADLQHLTKGRVNKRFPVPSVLDTLLGLMSGWRRGGPLFVRRAVACGTIEPRLSEPTRETLASEYRRRVTNVRSAARRKAIRRRLMLDAGAADYDQIDAEFREVAQRAGLGPEWTLKGLRHHFASSLERANIPHYLRKYFMGHRVPQDPLKVYTEITFEDVEEHYGRLLATKLAPIVEAIQERAKALGLTDQR
jgi:integrase